MERRDRSLKALKELNYIDSLDTPKRASKLISWVEEYLSNDGVKDFDLELEELKKLSELIYKNLTFIKEQKEGNRTELLDMQKMRKFLQNK